MYDEEFFLRGFAAIGHYEASKTPLERAGEREQFMPRMYKGSYAIIPLILTLPIFSVSRGGDVQVDATWTRKGVGSVRYKGPQLSQSHLTVFLGLAHMRQGASVIDFIGFRPSTFLASIGWSDNTRNKNRLTEILDDMHAARIKVWGVNESEEHAARVSIVAEWRPADEASTKWTVWLSPTVLRLFQGHLTRLSTAKRQMLKEGLGTFLFGYISANSCELPFSYEELHSASGSTGACNADFAKEIRDRLASMKDLKIIKDYAQRKGGVKVWK